MEGEALGRGEGTYYMSTSYDRDYASGTQQMPKGLVITHIKLKRSSIALDFLENCPPTTSDSFADDIMVRKRTFRNLCTSQTKLSAESLRTLL